VGNENGINQLAKLFKERENKPYLGPQIGKVLTSPPDIKVSLGNSIILEKDRLRIAAHLISQESVGYQTEENSIVLSGDMPGADDDTNNKIGTIKFYDGTPSGKTETIMEININKGTKYEAFYKLLPGDEVILIPSTDEQIYFLVDKVVNL